LVAALLAGLKSRPFKATLDSQIFYSFSKNSQAEQEM